MIIRGGISSKYGCMCNIFGLVVLRMPTTRGPELMTTKAYPYVDFDPLVCMYE